MKKRDELETVIRQSAADKYWVVFTEDPKILRKMTRLFGPGKPKSALGQEWVIPQSAVGLRKPRFLSDSAKATAAARLLAATNPGKSRG